MSLVDLLFPPEQLEALGNKWHEPTPKRRKLDSGDAQLIKEAPAPQWSPKYDKGTVQRRHRYSTPAPYQYGKRPSSSEEISVPIVKRSNSDSQPSASNIRGERATTSKSCFPSFIEPSILKNYLRHLHPKDSRRYTSHTSSRRVGSDAQETRPPLSLRNDFEEAVSSPGSLLTDSSSSPASTENCPTPAAVCEQFRSGPFGHVFAGMRLTDNERDMVEDLLSPSPKPYEDEVPGHKSQQVDLQVAIASLEGGYQADDSIWRAMFPTLEDKPVHTSSTQDSDSPKSDADYDVHSSGLSPAAEEVGEDIATSHRGIVVYEYDALSVDDFFDLDEAST